MANETLFIVLVALCGLCVGSLLNVVVYRLPLMMRNPHNAAFNLWLPHSHCPQCKTPVGWRDNLPLLSWLLLRGRCRHCKMPISRRYPFVELATLLLSLLMALLFPVGYVLLAALLLTWTLLALALIDYDCQLLPDALTQPLLWLGLIFQVFQLLPESSLEAGTIGAISGYMSLWLLATGYRLIRGKEALGLGDAKLLAALGAWLGWQPLPTLLLIASAAGIMWVILSRLLTQRPLDAPFPFGPSLAGAGLLLFIVENYDALM